MGEMDYLFEYKNINGKSHRCIPRICPICGELYLAPVTKLKRNLQLVCSNECKFKSRKGNGHPLWDKEKIIFVCSNCGKINIKTKSRVRGEVHNFCNSKCQNKFQIGNNNPCWRGGITKTVSAFRTEDKYYYWRNSCMARDNFTCQECGKYGGLLNVHHKKRVADIFKEYNITSKDEYMACKELWDLNNGITLCEECHKKIHFGVKDDYEC